MSVKRLISAVMAVACVGTCTSVVASADAVSTNELYLGSTTEKTYLSQFTNEFTTDSAKDVDYVIAYYGTGDIANYAGDILGTEVSAGNEDAIYNATVELAKSVVSKDKSGKFVIDGTEAANLKAKFTEKAKAFATDYVKNVVSVVDEKVNVAGINGASTTGLVSVEAVNPMNILDEADQQAVWNQIFKATGYTEKQIKDKIPYADLMQQVDDYADIVNTAMADALDEAGLSDLVLVVRANDVYDYVKANYSKEDIKKIYNENVTIDLSIFDDAEASEVDTSESGIDAILSQYTKEELKQKAAELGIDVSNVDVNNTADMDQLKADMKAEVTSQLKAQAKETVKNLAKVFEDKVDEIAGIVTKVNPNLSSVRGDIVCRSNYYTGNANNTYDGACKTNDLVALQKYLLGIEVLSGTSLQNADVTANGEVNTMDLVRMKNYLLGRTDIDGNAIE